ncbi:Stealth CR1 domain-containing protein [Jeotgalibaca ciconiae]|uniref:Capsule biosynthesis protein CapG n=1 Tax=Jeotgalibaca ciconiae TaxID=2496265 RepID=A0A3Q9BMA2_9LACT|nr:Stealth CR1 domain-containing protein [Jeotgalibaca ciconiae]AZP05753.1 hypothetical protein EJN90_09865 [Jeotgalibaca ciconiae]
MSQPIDFVIMWVDGSDSEWRKKKNKYSGVVDTNIDDSDERYRDWNNLELWFQTVEVFAPWVNQVYLLTDNQVLDFVSKYPQVKVVDHTEFIPVEYLPTFNSHAIELNAHRIEGLSEQFVLFNDDMFIIKPVQPTDFFVDGKPKDSYAANIINGVGKQNLINYILLNNMTVINEHFDKKTQLKKYFKKWFNLQNGPFLLKTLLLTPWPHFTGFVEPHIANSYLKSTFREVWEKEFDMLDSSCRNKFRHQNDVNQWVMRNWQLAAGTPVNRKHNFGHLFMVDENNLDECVDWIKNQKTSMVCVNDESSIKDFTAVTKRVNDALASTITNNKK